MVRFFVVVLHACGFSMILQSLHVHWRPGECFWDFQFNVVFFFCM
ncbi:hypothetical protein GLYMA_01G038350v4 [Glycine max]|nr:hypothetical protein GLYMA_01G038350v4 [Glycine max]KAH1161502.1 hypothetical protein GYH30_000396 [Glycine max]